MRRLLKKRTVRGMAFVALVWPSLLHGQDRNEESRVLAEEEVEAIQSWANRRLSALGESSGEGADIPLQVSRLRALYYLTLAEKDRLDEARALARSLSRDPDLPASLRPSVEALGGALEVVRAKHSRWPPNKLKYLNSGVSALDSLVAMEPANVEVRYLRLMSCYYLPFFVSRDDSVKEDFRALSRLLPLGGGPMPDVLYENAIRFVLENGELEEAAEKRLQETLG
jgi:hypothetical protein